MRYQLFGRTGLRVSQLALGTMTFGGSADKAASKAIFDAYVAAGGNFIDTASMYTGGSSERIVGELVHSDRNRYVLATKYTASLRHEDPNAGGNHFKSMVGSVEASLKKLNTDYIDLLWVHMWDGSTPVEEVMRGFEHLVESGKVLYIGVSDWPAWRVAEANTLAHFRGWPAFAGLQIEYSLVQRTPERELLPMAEAYGMTVTPWSPLGGGLLTDRYKSEQDLRALLEKRGEMLFEEPEFLIRIVQEVQAVAKEANRSPVQAALNWLRQRGTLPILGASNVGQVQDALGCLDWQLNAPQMERLDKVSAIRLGFPHEFLTSPPVLKFFYGGETRNKVDWRDPIAF